VLTAGSARRAGPFAITWPTARSGGRTQAVAAADGQLIRTLTPELVDETCTSSARPEITASPNPAGTPASSAPWIRAAVLAGPPWLTPWPLVRAAAAAGV